MIFRRIKAKIEAENWFAVGVDFFIVVIGVFIGLQVSNWNEAQRFNAQETELLYELKKEIQNSIIGTNLKIDSYAQVHSAGKRSLDFISSNASCDAECWPFLVDFMHASQWQGLDVQRSAYENMRRIGLPRNKKVVDRVEAYLEQVDAAVQAFSDKPYYRTKVRQLIPYQAQAFYWQNCHHVLGGIEKLIIDCPSGVSAETALEVVETIKQNSEIQPHLTEWTGTVIHTRLSNQNILAEKAIEEIDAELARR